MPNWPERESGPGVGGQLACACVEGNRFVEVNMASLSIYASSTNKGYALLRIVYSKGMYTALD